MKITAKTIAEQVGVCQQVVSAVLNGNTRKTSAATRARILSVADRLNYRPNHIAGMLRSGKGKFIAVLFPTIANPFYAELTLSLNRRINASGFITIISHWDSYESFDLALDNLLGCGLAGIITSHEKLDRIPSALPVVTYGLAHPAFDSVLPDDDACLEELLNRLRDLGHRKFAFVGFWDGSNRAQIWRNWMIRNNLPLRDEWILHGNFPDFRGGRDAADAMARAAERPTAVIAINDVTAMSLISGFAAHKIRVPEEISVSGCDNIRESGCYLPSLTTIDLDAENIAAMLAQTLLERINGGGGAARHLRSHAELLWRDSVAAPPGSTCRFKESL